MRTLVASLAHPRTRLHDYREAHRVKIQVEKEHVVMVLGYGLYLVFHHPALVFMSYGLVTLIQGKMMIVVAPQSSK